MRMHPSPRLGLALVLSPHRWPRLLTKSVGARYWYMLFELTANTARPPSLGLE